MVYIKQLLIALTIVTLCGCKNAEEKEIERLVEILLERDGDLVDRLNAEEKDKSSWYQFFVTQKYMIMDVLNHKARKEMEDLIRKINAFDRIKFEIQKTVDEKIEAEKRRNSKREKELEEVISGMFGECFSMFPMGYDPSTFIVYKYVTNK